MKQIAWLLLLLTTACGGVASHVHTEVPAPRAVAVLPFAGNATRLADSGRALLRSRLLARGYLVPEPSWVDRVLAENMWLRDPVRFDPASLPVAEACAALAVDAIVVARQVDESSFNFLLLRRHALSGDFRLRLGDGRDYWSATHTAGSFGGFLLTSGQVFTELRAQGEHGTPLETLSLLDELVADVAGTIPTRTPSPLPGAAPAITNATVERAPAADVTRIVVEATASPNATLRIDLVPHAVGVPMVAAKASPTSYRGALDIAPTVAIERIVVHAVDCFGRSTSMEVRQ